MAKSKNSYKATKGERKSRKKEKSSDPNKKKLNFLAPLKKINKAFDDRRFKRISGIFLLFTALYLFFAFSAYLFTWKADQSLVMDRNLWEFLFNSEIQEVDNWLGKFGAWISHYFIYRGFGLASYGFVLISLILGVKQLFNFKILPPTSSTWITLTFIVWTSLALGFFSNEETAFLGGTFGYFLNSWFESSFGAIGAFILTLVILFTLIVIIFNPKFEFLNLSKRKPDEEINDGVETQSASNEYEEDQDHQEEDDTENDAEIIEDVPLTTENDSEEEEDKDDNVPIEEELEQDVFPSKDDLDEIEDGGFSIEVNKEQDELSEEELSKKHQEYGEYDPTLDLSSYQAPGIDLLVNHGGDQNTSEINKEELEDNKNRIVETLGNYKIEIDKIKATIGPTVTLYEIVPAPGVRISKIKNLEDDIALSLSALGIRIIAPIPGRGTIGIEVPNSKREIVSMRTLIASKKFQECDMDLPIAMGKSISNETMVYDLAKMPHMLIAGATGQGKSVGINAILISLLYKKHPSQLKFVLIDPKKVELPIYNKIERHFLAKLPNEEEAIITDTSKVINTVNSLCIEMDDRYEMLKNAATRNIKEYNKKFINRKLNPEEGHRYLPYIVLVIDEFADLIMTAGKEVEMPIARLAQLARAVGIHLIVATQRPSVNVITGTIKANFPARIAFKVMAKIDSRTILDAGGADQLTGKGDMLISTGSEIKRIQCGFVDTPEVEDICEFIGEQRGYPDAFMLPEYEGEDEKTKDVDLDEKDALFEDAARVVVVHQQGSASLLQRKLKLGYNRAGRIVDQLEAAGIIGPFKGSKAREVLIPDEMTLNEKLNNL